MDVLDSLMQDSLDQAQRSPPADGASVERYQPQQVVKRLNYSHDAMIDLIIACPGITQNQIALEMGYTPSWVSQVVNSDAFQAKLAARKAELVDPELTHSAEERLRGLHSRSLEILKEKLNRPASAIPDNLAIRTLEISSRALGYGAKEQTKIEINQTSVEQHLTVLGSNLEKLLSTKRNEASLLEEEPLDAVTSTGS